MKSSRLFLALAALSAAAASALAMDASSVPTKFPIWWGTSASPTYIRNIPEASQIGTQNCAASLTDGFPPLTFTPPSAGGCPPFGQDMNGILRQLSQWARWQSAGATVKYDASFSSGVGGYPAGAVLANASTNGCYWINTSDNNTTDPDAGGANWSASCPAGGIAATSGGAANLQTVTATPFVLARGSKVSFVAGFSNTGALQINVNSGGNVAVFRKTNIGAGAMVGGEVLAGQLIAVEYDGTQWQCTSCATARVGSIETYASTSTSTPQAGYLFADGSCQSQASLPALFAVIGTTYGNCGAGTFRVPDGRATALVGADTQGTAGAASRLTSGGSGCAGNTLGTVCGSSAQTITLATANLPAYTPAGTNSIASLTATVAASQVTYSTDPAINVPVWRDGGTSPVTFGGSIPFTGTAQGGTSTPFSNVQPTTIVTTQIKL